MNIATRIAQRFGLTPLHDVDLPDEPSASVAALLWPPSLADSSPRHGSPGEDGPTASTEQAGAVGHPLESAELREVRALVQASEDVLRDELDLIRQVLNDAAIEARWLTSNIQAAMGLLDEIDPTPAELAAVSDVTDIDRKRKGRQSRE